MGGGGFKASRPGGTLHGGLSQIGELQNPAPGGRVFLDAPPDSTIREEIVGLIDGAPLQPVCETVMKRTTSELMLFDGTRAELAVEVGGIKAGKRAAELSEIEIELTRPHSGDERRQLSSRDSQEGATAQCRRARRKPKNQGRSRRRHLTAARIEARFATLRAPQCVRQPNSQGLHGPFLSTRPLHFYAAIWHNLSPPLTHLRFINNAILLIGSIRGPRPKPDLLESQTLSR